MKKLSFLAVLACFACMIILNLHFKFYEKEGRIIESDAKHYYSYIPAVLVHKDISLSFMQKSLNENARYYYTDIKLPDGRNYFLTTMGVALLEAVFVVPIHYTLKLTNQPTTGVSMPYKVGIVLSALFYFLVGLLLIRYLLLYRLKIEDSVAALTILAIGAGTNIVAYVMREPGMSHVYSFFSIILFVYLLDKFFTRPSLRIGFLTGLAAGLIVLIRPVNVIVLILFITWNVGTIKDFTERILFFFKKPAITALIVAGAIFIWIPQFTYYYYLTGNIFFNGYGETTKFFFNNPQIVNNLFSYKKGWFLYTPVMFFAVLGLIPLYLKQRMYFWPVLSVLLILIYFNSSWFSWWFGGSFGQRAYIDIYGILAFPLAHSIKMIWSRRLVKRLLTVLIVILLVSHNLFQVFQFINGAIHFSEMTKEAYCYSLGRIKPGVRFYALLEPQNSDLARIGIYPKPKNKQKSEEEWIKYIATRFKESPEMMKFLTEKSASSGKDLETLIYDDARYTLKKDRVFCEGVINSDWHSLFNKKARSRVD